MSDPRRLGKYQLIAELARGGMGVVYLAVSSGLGGFSKLLVIKELKPELVEDQGFLEMFLEEARLAARLSHPNIVPTYEVGMEGNRPFIVMDYLEGQTLARVLRKKIDGFSVHHHLRVLTLALDGLQYAHRLEDFDGSVTSVVHRDVSPQNVFITYDGQVKVVDFGIAKASDTTVETRTGVFKGKPSYMAPEQLQGDIDPRSDVFAIGIMIWEALAARRMWQKKTDVEILTALLKGAIPSIDEVAPEVPEPLRRICKKALAVDLGERYASAKDLRDDIDAYLDSVGDRSSLKEIGTLIARSFQEQREKLRGIIERCIAESKSGEALSRSKLPSISPPSDESSGPSGPSKPSKPTQASATLRVEAAPLSGPQSELTGTPAGATVDAARDDEPLRKKSAVGFIVLGAVAVAAVVGAIALGATKSDATKDRVPVAAAPSPSPSLVSAPAAPAAEPTPSAAASSAPQESASTPSTKAAPPARVVYAHTPPAPKPAPPAPAKPTMTVTPPPAPAPSPAPSAKLDCNPPFYFEGTKKVFKPGCL